VGGCKKVYIFGYSGHAYVLVESMLELGYIILGYFDRQEASFNPYSLKYLGYELDVNLNSIIKDNFVFPTVGDVNLREKIIKMFISENLNQFALIDNSAKVSKSAIIGVSTYVGKNSSVNALSKIGSGAIINTNSVVEHECEISDFVHIAPSATLAGNVKVGMKSFIGANSVTRESTSIGENCILGAGSVLLNNLPDNEIWVGNPARKKVLKKKKQSL
jgi:sugar O-acyltransferase (sialic acid O-acetyltransferase NeuD family)